MVGYNKRVLCNEWEECQPCLSDRHASCRSPGPSLVGLWPLAATARKGTRVSTSAKWAEWHKRIKAAPCLGNPQRACLLRTSPRSTHPAAQQQFESMARVPVLTTSSPQPAEGMARSPLRVVRVALCSLLTTWLSRRHRGWRRCASSARPPRTRARSWLFRRSMRRPRTIRIQKPVLLPSTSLFSPTRACVFRFELSGGVGVPQLPRFPLWPVRFSFLVQCAACPTLSEAHHTVFIAASIAAFLLRRKENGARLGLRSYEQERVRAALGRGSDGVFALR